MRRKKILILPKLCDRNGDLSKKWYIELSQRNPADGQMSRKRFEKFGDCNINDLVDEKSRRELAQKIIDDINHRLHSGWTIFNDVSETVREDQLQYAVTAKFYKKKVETNNNYSCWVSLYIEDVLNKQDLSKDSMDTYKGRYRVFGNWLCANDLSLYDLSAISNEVMIRFFEFLKNERKLCAHTYESYRYLLYSLFEFVLKKGGISYNPVYDIPENWRIVDNGAERIVKEDLDKLMKAIDDCDPQVGLACRFEYYCGMRPGYEIRLLKIGDIEFRKNCSRVVVTSENSKTGRLRKVIVPDIFLEYLNRVWHIETYDKELYVFGRNGEPGILPLGKNTLRDRFNRIKNRLGLPVYYKFYSMKHTGAVTLAELGVPIIDIRDHLGHTKIETTEIYLSRLGFNESKVIRNDFPEI
jgi:integrase